MNLKSTGSSFLLPLHAGMLRNLICWWQWYLVGFLTREGVTAWRYWCGKVPLSAERSFWADSGLTAARGQSCRNSSKGHPGPTMQPSDFIAEHRAHKPMRDVALFFCFKRTYIVIAKENLWYFSLLFVFKTFFHSFDFTAVFLGHVFPVHEHKLVFILFCVVSLNFLDF